MNRPVATLVLSSIVALAACTGDSNDGRVPGPDPVTVPPTTDAPPTAPPTEPDASTPVDTDPVDTTTSSTTSTTTTTEPAPTTTLDPIVEIEEEIKQVRLDGSAAFAAAESDPTNLSLREPFPRLTTGAQLEFVTDDLDELAQEGLALRPGDPDLTRLVFEGQVDLPDGIDSTVAFLDECFVNSDVLYAVATDERPDAVIDDGVFTFRVRSRYEFIDSTWKHAGGERIERIAGRDAC